MAVNAYTGLPGSGKSHSAVEYVILPALKKGKTVFTNIPMTPKATDQFPGLLTVFEYSELEDNSDWFQDVLPKGATVVLDEIQKLWPAGLTANKALPQHRQFLQEHRHLVGEDGFSTEVVLVTQDLGQVASFARALVNTTYRTVKLDVVGQSNKFRVDIYQGAATGPNPPERSRVRQLFGKYRKEVYDNYKSQTQSDLDGHGDESSADDRKNILNSKMLRVGFPALVVAVLVFIYFAYNSLSEMYAPEPKASHSAPGSDGSPVIQSVNPVPTPPAEKKYRHFFNGMKSYIAFNNGHYPWVDYRIAFVDDSRRMVIDATQLGKLGYAVIGYDACFLQLRGYGDVVNVFCEPDKLQDTGENKEIFEF